MAENTQENLITLVDNEGNQKEFQIMMTIDGQEQFGKNYIIVAPTEEPEGEEIELLTFSFVPNEEDVTTGELQPLESQEEWTMVNDIFGQFVESEPNAFDDGVVNVVIANEEEK